MKNKKRDALVIATIFSQNLQDTIYKTGTYCQIIGSNDFFREKESTLNKQTNSHIQP